MKIKNIALVIAHDGFQPVEYHDIREVLEKNGYQVTPVSDKIGKTVDAHGKPGPEITISVDQVQIADYAGIFLIGGAGALKCLDNQKVYDVMRRTRDVGLLWGAICIAPRILYNAGLLGGARITGWDDDHKLKASCPEAHIIDTRVVVDGTLVTGQGPQAAREFGQAIVDALAS
jgi:protease I